MHVKIKSDLMKMEVKRDFFSKEIILPLILPSISFLGWLSCIAFASHYNYIAHVLVFSNAHVFIVTLVNVING